MGNGQDKSLVTITEHTEGEFSYKIINCVYEWEINNFKTLDYKTGTHLTSQKLKLDVDKKIDEWEIVLYPEGLNKRTADFLSIWLKRISTDERLVQFTCEIISAENNKSIKKTIKQKLSIESVLGWSAFCKRSYIFEKKFLKSENLVLKCTLQIYDDKCIDNPALEDEDPYMDDRLSELSNDFKEWLLMKKNCDIKFDLGKETISAHTAFLSARSPVFQKMFDAKLELGQKIYVSDISKEVFSAMLLFLYSGEYKELENDKVFDLYYAADKYKLLSLRRCCSKILATNLSVENAVKVIILADKYSDVTLQYSAVQFIAKNAKEVQKKSEWLELMRSSPNLANVVFEYLAKLNPRNK